MELIVLHVWRLIEAVKLSIQHLFTLTVLTTACHLVKLRHERCVKMLQHFEHATREISADKYLSVSKVIFLAQSLQHLTVESVSSHSTLRQKLLRSMAKRFTALNLTIHLLLAYSWTLGSKRLALEIHQLATRQSRGLQWKWHVLFQQVVIMGLQLPNLWIHLQQKNRNYHN